MRAAAQTGGGVVVGRFGQMNSASMEFLLRVVTGILSFLMVPIALILIPFGILLRATAVAAGKKDLTFVRPPDEAYEAAAYVLHSGALSILHLPTHVAVTWDHQNQPPTEQGGAANAEPGLHSPRESSKWSRHPAQARPGNAARCEERP